MYLHRSNILADSIQIALYNHITFFYMTQTMLGITSSLWKIHACVSTSRGHKLVSLLTSDLVSLWFPLLSKLHVIPLENMCSRYTNTSTLYVLFRFRLVCLIILTITICLWKFVVIVILIHYCFSKVCYSLHTT